MAKEDKKIDFESSLKELESIVEKLEDENINLEDSVKSFEEGVNLVKQCQKQLQDAELKVKKLLDSVSVIVVEKITDVINLLLFDRFLLLRRRSICKFIQTWLFLWLRWFGFRFWSFLFRLLVINFDILFK